MTHKYDTESWTINSSGAFTTLECAREHKHDVYVYNGVKTVDCDTCKISHVFDYRPFFPDLGKY